MELFIVEKNGYGEQLYNDYKRAQVICGSAAIIGVLAGVSLMLSMANGFTSSYSGEDLSVKQWIWIVGSLFVALGGLVSASLGNPLKRRADDAVNQLGISLVDKQATVNQMDTLDPQQKKQLIVDIKIKHSKAVQACFEAQKIARLEIVSASGREKGIEALSTYIRELQSTVSAFQRLSVNITSHANKHEYFEQSE